MLPYSEVHLHGVFVVSACIFCLLFHRLYSRLLSIQSKTGILTLKRGSKIISQGKTGSLENRNSEVNTDICEQRSNFRSLHSMGLKEPITFTSTLFLTTKLITRLRLPDQGEVLLGT